MARLKYVPDNFVQEKAAPVSEFAQMKKEAEHCISKIKDKLKNPKNIKKAAMIIEEMIGSTDPKKSSK